MSITSAFEYAARAFEEPQRKYATPGELARALDPRTKQTPALDLIDEALVELADTPDGRLIVSVAPQEGKSTRAAKDFPTWMLTQNPNTRIVAASYGQNLANRNGLALRRNISTHPGLGLAIAPDNGAKHEWQLAGHDGGVLAVGIGAGLTGRPADCVSGDTHIECEYGVITAGEAFEVGITRIRAYDHTTGWAVWRKVEAARRIPGRRVVTVITESGRSLVCTPDHRVYTGRGYVAARDLRRGDALVALVAPGPVSLWSAARDAEDGRAKSDSTRPEPVLLAAVHGADVRSSQPDPRLLGMRRCDTAQPQDDLQPGLPSASAGEVSSRDRLSAVRAALPAKVVEDGVLQPDMREQRALDPDGRQRKLALQDRDELRPLVPVDAAVDPGTRRPRVCGLPRESGAQLHAQRAQGGQVFAGDPSHQRGRDEQPPRESDHALLDVPRCAPQVEADTVAMVRGEGEDVVDVYDFQVEGTRNFFGGGLLVHNCLIIDDPIKDRKEADSALYRQNVWEWWTDSASTRLAPGAPVILILTRWHEDDLAGRLLAQEDGHLWRVINIPAQADHDPEKGQVDPLDREPGEFLQSARGRTPEQWEAIKVRVGSRTWNALYQGRPSPAEGGMFKRDQWREYDVPPWLVRDDGSHIVTHYDEIIASWDMAFKDTAQSDYVVGQVWMRRGADAYLLDQVRGRMDFVTTCARFREFSAKWPQATLKLVEDKANGTAVINALRRIVNGIVPEEPHGSKEARASAVTPLVEAGNVWLPSPEIAPWIGDLIEEAAAFPTGAHDDQCDALSQALNRLVLAPLLAGQDLIEPDEFDELDQRGYTYSPY